MRGATQTKNRRVEFEALQRKLDAVELRRRAEASQVVELRRIRPAIER